MQKLLTIYKFNIPFIDEKFELIKYDSILEDLENLFVYEEEFKNKKISIIKKVQKTTFELKNYKAELNIFNSKENNSTGAFSLLNKKNRVNNKYFIPKLEFTFYIKEENINNELLKNIFDIFISTGSKNYIFNYNKNDFFIKNSSKILTLDILKESLYTYNYNDLNKFLKNTSHDYIGEELMMNNKLRNSFYYIIYLCYNFYKTLIRTENGRKEIKNILRKNLSLENNSILKLSETRLNLLEKDLISNFINYKKVLDKLFFLLK